MIQHIKKNTLITLIFLVNIAIGCKNNKEKIIDDKETSNLIEESTEENAINEEKINSNYDQYIFYTTYFQSGGETDLPEITDEEVVKKFKNYKLFLSKDTIIMDGIRSFYKIENKNSKKFFGKEYIYNYNVDLYKNFFNTDIKDNVNYINLDVNNNDLSPFKDYFLEAGDAIYENNCLFLNYKRYVVCFKKEDKLKGSDKKSSELPFDFERVYRLCQKDNRSLYKELCTNEYPVFEFKNENELKENLKQKLNNKNPLYYYKLNVQQLNKINLIVVITETDEESYGDQFLVSLKDNNTIIDILSNNEDDFFHSRNFVVNKDLTITVYEINGLHPKEKINLTYKINNDGTFVKK